MPAIATAAVLAVTGYILGSISAAILTCRCLGRPDPRGGGSRNPGATNVLRIAGRDAAAITLAGDVLKGVAPVLLARWLVDDPLIWALSGLGAFVGHLYPVFFGFAGGKGVATALGVLTTVAPVAGALTVAVWLLTFSVARTSWISAITAFATAPVWTGLVAGSAGVATIVAAMSILLIWRHRQNIREYRQARQQH